jgi:hypothetical protein
MHMRRVLRQTWTLLATVVVLFTMIGAIGRGDAISDVRMVAGGHQQDIVRWELTHFMDKWVSKVADFVLRRDLEQNDRAAAIAEFFNLREPLQLAESRMRRALAGAPGMAQVSAETLQQEADRLRSRRGELRPIVEETIESAISDALVELGIIGSLGPLRWPPVDFTFEEGGLVLVRSPRDEIRRLTDLLLEPNLSLLEQMTIEREVEELDGNTSALVVRIGGVATYPAQVSPDYSLHGTLIVTSHEWLHHWLYFRPLGKLWFRGGVMQSINETVANIVGEEVGDVAYERLTGQSIERAPWVPPVIGPHIELPEETFNYRREMQRTRAHLEELLRLGLVEDAEEYLEERQQLFVANGYYTRKLNNAWFAFHGTYADGAASISPIEGQLRAVRAAADGLAEFLDRIAAVVTPAELEAMALDAGWVPIDTRTGLPLG